jgi:hypothetical protein
MPYLVVPHMSGETGIGQVPPVTVSVSPSDIFSHLQFGAMLFLQARKGPWAVGLDGLYMDLKQDILPDATRASGTVEMQQGAVELLVLREVVRGIEVGLGGRLNVIGASLDAQLNVGNTPQRAKSGSTVWFDPLVATRLTVPGTGKWHLAVEGDLGGFGVGSKFAWQVWPVVGYRFTNLFELAVGYRALGMDYTTGSGTTTFKYDMRIYGPVVGLAFHF